MGLDPRIDDLYEWIRAFKQRIVELETKINDHLDTHEETKECKVHEI